MPNYILTRLDKNLLEINLHLKIKLRNYIQFLQNRQLY